jgi:hypothetical protein
VVVCVCDAFFPFQIVSRGEGRRWLKQDRVCLCVCGILFLDFGLDEEISEWVELFLYYIFIYCFLDVVVDFFFLFWVRG